MASRNKKGKIHGIFKSEFQISFFHKPSMKETDIYYYIVLEDIIFIKMRLLFDIVLVIDEIYGMTSSYIEPYYQRLFQLLKTQTSVTVIISLVGNTTAFRQTCQKFQTPVIEHESFLDCSSQFYSKFKNYCGNNPNYFGFYLVALKDDTFSIIESYQTGTDNIEEEDINDSVQDSVCQPKIEQSQVDTKSTAVRNDITQYIEEDSNFPEIVKYIQDKFPLTQASFNNCKLSISKVDKHPKLPYYQVNIVQVDCNDTIGEFQLIVFGNTIQISNINSKSVSLKIDVLHAFQCIHILCDWNICVINVDAHDVLYHILHEEYTQAKLSPQNMSAYVNPKLPIFNIG